MKKEKAYYHVFTGDGNFVYSKEEIPLTFTPKDFEENKLEIIEAYGWEGMYGTAILLRGRKQNLVKFIRENTYYGASDEENEEMLFTSKKKAWENYRSFDEDLYKYKKLIKNTENNL